MKSLHVHWSILAGLFVAVAGEPTLCRAQPAAEASSGKTFKADVSADTRLKLATTLLYAHRYDEAIAEFEKVVAGSLADGTAGPGRGFVLMPSACPCGRTIAPRTMANYETMVRLAAG